jgi:WD40 repeat protein
VRSRLYPGAPARLCARAEEGLRANEGRLCSAVYDATNDYLFIGTGSSKLLVYDMSQATPTLVHLLSGHADAVRALYQCPQSGYLVSGSFDATCQIWTTSAPTGAASMSGLERRTASIGSFVGTKSKIKLVAICNSANFIATGHDNGAILLWDSHNGLINFVLHDHSSSVVDMQWVDSQNTLISAGRDGKIFFYTVQPRTRHADES